MRRFFVVRKDRCRPARRPPLGIAFFAAVLGAWGCHLGGGVDLDSGRHSDGADGASAEAGDGAPLFDGDAHEDEGDTDRGPGSGPFTQIVTDIEVSGVRLCDLDGDGREDNAVADLGPPTTDLFIIAYNALLAASIDEQPERLVGHVPWIDDLRTSTDPAVRFILYEGRDDDDDRTDDLSGHEAFAATADSLDQCGEPLHQFPRTSIDHGWVESGAGTIPVPTPGQAATVHVEHSEGYLGDSADCCGYFLISEIGTVTGVDHSGGLSLLEIMIAGGSAFGLDSFPGLSPDLDFDGDGLEGIEVDDDGAILRCLDGDATVIPGRDCWQDDRMADAFSLNVTLFFAEAQFGGRYRGWESVAERECPEGPPEPSAWDPD